MRKLDTTIEQLISEARIKTKWSELESHGAVEFLNLLFQEQFGYGSLAHSIIVEDKVVCINLFEGAPYNSPEGQESIIRMYIDIEDNIILLARSCKLYLYETEGIDASDLRHYYGKD